MNSKAVMKSYLYMLFLIICKNIFTWDEQIVKYLGIKIDYLNIPSNLKIVICATNIIFLAFTYDCNPL
jgi:hypothetical protein